MPTRYFALIAGIIYLLIGVLGFVPTFKSIPPFHAPDLAVEAGDGYLFGLFRINVLHNLVHLGLGLWGVLAYKAVERARTFARGLAIIYGLFAIMGLIPILNTTFGLVPLHGHDIWLHALTAIVAAYFGFVREDRPVRFHAGTQVHG